MDFRPCVDRLFRDAPDHLNPTRQNPVTGACWVRGIDRPGPQKRAARRALVAREYFAWKNPGMPPLPLSYAEREKLKENGGIDYIVSVYSYSLKLRSIAQSRILVSTLRPRRDGLPPFRPILSYRT